MAVELRCPDCRAKLRLKAAPEAGTEVECPKCGTAFPAPELHDEDDTPKKKKVTQDEDEPTEKKEKKPKVKKGAKDAGSKGPRKRKFKKRETSKAALIGVIAAGVLMTCFMTGVLIWYFTRTSKAVEMLYYAPEDSQTAMGMNLGHAQKYPAFYKSIQSLLGANDFKVAGDAIAKAAGTDMDALVDHFVKAVSVRNGWSIIFRTKTEFDGESLAKLPGAEKKSLDGKTYYSAPGLLPGNGRGLVFAPTNRLIVVCPPEMEGQGEFRKIISGHAGNQDATLGIRMGALGKRVTRGTFWQMTVFDGDVKADSVIPSPQGGQIAGGEDTEGKFRTVVTDALNGAKGYGMKASLGSRELRFEIIVWKQDGEKASEFAKKMKDSDLGKGDAETPPKWFKEKTSFGDKKVGAQLLSNIGFGASGEIFFARSAVETLDIQQAASTALGKVTGLGQQSGGMPGAPPGGRPPAGPPGGRPPGMRRRFGARR